MANDKLNASADKGKKGKGVDFSLDDMDFDNGFVIGEDDEEIGLLQGVADEQDFKFTINGVQLEKKLLDPHMLTVNKMIPLFDGASIELTSASINILDKDSSGTKRAKAEGGRLIVSPRRAGFVIETPISEVMLKDDETKQKSDFSVKGVLNSTFAFPLKNGYLFIADQGLFDDEEVMSTSGGQVLAGNKRVKADALVTKDGLAIGNKDKLAASLQKAGAKRAAKEQESSEQKSDELPAVSNDNPPTTQEVPAEATEDVAEPKENEEPKEEDKVFEGAGIEMTKTVVTSESNQPEEEKKEEEEDENILKEKLEEKKKQLKEYLKSHATEILTESFAVARSDLALSQLIDDPKGAFKNFKDHLWENFKTSVRRHGEQIYEDAQEELKGLPDEVWDEVSGYVWEKEEEFADKIEWAMAVISNAAAFLNIAKYFGVNTEPIEKAVDNTLNAITGLQEGAEDKLGKVFPKEEGEEEEEKKSSGDDDSKRITVTFEVVPGFSVNLFLEPAYSLTFGGYLRMNPGYRGRPITINLGVDAYGFASLKVGVGAELGNELMAIIGEVSGKAEVFGILEESTKKFAEARLDNLRIGKIEKDGPVIEPPAVSGVRMRLGGGLDGELAALVKAKSELFDWEKVLLDRKLTAELGTALYEAEAKKEGEKLFSASGWHMYNQSLTTAFLNENKSKLIRLSLKDHTIANTEDLVGEAESGDNALEELDGRLTKLQGALDKSDNGKTLAAAFPKPGASKDKSIADSAAGVLDDIKTDYSAVFVNMQNTARTMQNEIEAFTQSSDYISVTQAVAEGENKHGQRTELMEDWKKANEGTLLSREEVLSKYRGLAVGSVKNALGMKTGYEREDEENTRKEAEDELYNKTNILEYEQAQIKKAAEKRQAHFDELMRLYNSIGKNPDKAEAFIKKYQDIVKDDPDGSLVDHLAEYGLDNGVFSNEEEAIQFLEDYEKERFDDATEKLANGIADVNKLLELLQADGKEDEFNSAFSEVFAYIDDDMWEAFVKENTNDEDRQNFYEKNAANSSAKNKPRVELLQKLRVEEKKYEDAESPEEQEMILSDSKKEFETLLKNTKYYNRFVNMFTSKTEWEDFMQNDEQYKRLSAEDIRNYATEYVSNEGFYGWRGAGKKDAAGKDIYECYSIFKGEDTAAMSQVLKHNETAVKAYNDYLSNAADKESISNHLAVWKLDKIRDYEVEKTDEYKKKGSIGFFSKEMEYPIEYFKHHERFKFLEKQINDIGLAGNSDKYYDKGGVIVETVKHYFGGTRPSTQKPYEYKDGKKQVTLKIEPAELYAKQYISEITGKYDVTDQDFRDRMVEALGFKMDEGKEARQKIADALDELSEEDKNDPRKVMEAWTKAGGDIDFMNTRKAANDYGFHEMKSYLNFKIEREADKFSEKAFIKAAQTEPIDGKEALFTPKKMMAFAETYRKGIGKKHSTRLDLINEYKSAKKPYSELIEAYDELERRDSSGKVEWAKKSFRSFFSIGHQSGYDKFLQKNEALRKKITPDMIMKFEVARIAEGNLKHSGRYKAVQEATEEQAREVYNKMHGGGAFYDSMKSRMAARAEEMRDTRTGAQELERIKAYEQRKVERYRQMKASVDKDIKELSEKRDSIVQRMNESSDFISATSAKVNLLRNRPQNMDQYKSIKDLSTPINAVKSDISKVADQKKEVEALKERIKSEGAKRDTQLKDLAKEIQKEKDTDMVTGV